MTAEASILDAQLIELAGEWIAESGEMYVIVRFSTGGYHAHEYLFTEFGSYTSWLLTLPAQAYVTFFLDPQLTHRGVVNNSFRLQVLEHWKPRAEWTIVELRHNERLRVGAWCEDEKEVDQILEEFRGLEAAAGPTPKWWERDHSRMQSGLVPMPDGSVRIGLY